MQAVPLWQGADLGIEHFRTGTRICGGHVMILARGCALTIQRVVTNSRGPHGDSKGNVVLRMA